MSNLEKLFSYVPHDKEILFVCVGTDRSTGDSLAPLIGTRLKETGFDVLGTLHEPIHAVNLQTTIDYIKDNYADKFVIAIDASLGKFDQIGDVTIHNESLSPGAGVNKKLPKVGDVSITGVVNISGFMEYFVLQNTRLALVMDMVDKIYNLIMQFTEKRKSILKVAIA